MPTLQRVLVAVDGSPAADRAFAYALEIGRHYGSELILCTAVDREAAVAALSAPDGPVFAVEAIFDTLDATAETLLGNLSARATAAGARFTTKRLDGRTAVALTDYAHDAGVDAIVMGTQGKRGLERLFLGSTADGVLRLTTVPVFVVHSPDEDAPPPAPRAFARILVALDDSDPADAAVSFALDLAVPTSARVLCCTVLETTQLFGRAAAYGYDPAPYLADMRAAAASLIEPKAALAAERGLTLESVIVEGHPSDAILATAAAQAADLIVMGTHGRRGLRRLFIGSVAERVVRGSVIPAAVVRTAPTSTPA